MYSCPLYMNAGLLMFVFFLGDVYQRVPVYVFQYTVLSGNTYLCIYSIYIESVSFA